MPYLTNTSDSKYSDYVHKFKNCILLSLVMKYFIVGVIFLQDNRV